METATFRTHILHFLHYRGFMLTAKALSEENDPPLPMAKVSGPGLLYHSWKMKNKNMADDTSFYCLLLEFFSQRGLKSTTEAFRLEAGLDIIDQDAHASLVDFWNGLTSDEKQKGQEQVNLDAYWEKKEADQKKLFDEAKRRAARRAKRRPPRIIKKHRRRNRMDRRVLLQTDDDEEEHENSKGYYGETPPSSCSDTSLDLSDDPCLE